jgi:hypothetical protein
MHVVAATRLVLARRPWLYWAIVTVLAAGVAVAVHQQSSALDAARDDWRTTRTVLVAERALDPGDTIATRRVDLPVAALPPGALEELPDRAALSQRIGIGEVLTDVDITTRPGPAARADPGTVVLAVPDPLSRASFVGLRVLVAAEGQVLSSTATIVEVDDGVSFVAVPEADAASVAAATQAGSTTLLYVP